MNLEEVARLDYERSNTIALASNDDIVGELGGVEGAIAEYERTLASNQPRSAAFLMSAIINVAIGQDEKNAEVVVADTISRLPMNNMASDMEEIINKITGISTKPRVLFSSSHWLTGGMERVMATLFDQLKDDYDIYLITPYHEGVSSITVPSHVTNIKIANTLFTQYFDSIVLTYALLLHIDVVVGFVNMFNKQTNLYKLCEGTGIKTIASNHEYYLYPYKSKFHYKEVKQRLDGFLKADAVIWPNNFNAALCGSYVNNTYVIGNPNSYEVTARLKQPSSNVIICVGRFNDRIKRVDRMIEAFSLVLKSIPDAKLILVGKYDNDEEPGITHKQIKATIRRYGIRPESIEFTGEVSNVQDYYLRAKALMVTSESEGFAMSINEAACLGIPSVCNYFPGVEDLISDGQNGFITEQGDVEGMSNRLIDILTSAEVHKRLSLQAMQMADRFSVGNVGDNWRFLIKKLLDNDNSAMTHETLNTKIGYKVEDKDRLIKLLASELNEIFYQFVDKKPELPVGQRESGNLFVRLKASIKGDGLKTTLKKIVIKLRHSISKL